MAEPNRLSGADFVRRLDKLERQNRRLRQGVALILTILGTLLLIAQSSPKRTVEAEEFILRDAAGRIRAKLGMWTAEPSFALYDSAGRAKVLMDGNGPAVHLSDANAIPRLSIMVDESGAGFSVSDTRGRLRGVLGTRDSQNATTVSFYDEKAMGRAAIGLVANGPLVTLQDASLAGSQSGLHPVPLVLQMK